MRHRCRLHLRRTDALARHLDRVVGAAGDVPEAVVVDPRPVAVDPDPRQAAPVRVEIPIRIAPEALGHPGPRLADDQLPHLAAQRIAVRVHHVGRHAGARAGERARGDGRDGRAAHDPAADLGPARVVDDRDPLVRPPPGTATTMGRGSTARRSSPARRMDERSWARTGSAAVRHQRADRGGADPQVGDPVALHQVPQAIRPRIVGRALVDDERGAEQERRRPPPTDPSSSPCR